MSSQLLYLRVGFIIILGGLTLTLLVNLLVDPYSLYQMFEEKEFDHNVSHKAPWRLEAAYRVRREQPELIILGSSRVISGLNVKDPVWDIGGKPSPLNLALPGVNMTEIKAYFNHAHAIKPLTQVVLGLDFFSFNVFRSEIDDFDERRLTTATHSTQILALIRDMTSTLLSLDALEASLDALKASRNGHGDASDKSRPYRKVFQIMERAYMRGLWFPCPTPNFALDPVDAQTNQMDQLRDIVSIARRDGVDLKIFISPIHARLHETLYQVGLWEEYERWKRKLINLVYLENGAGTQGAALQLWDFSEYNQYTTENVPVNNNENSHMKWFLDSAHFTPDFGHLLLTDVLGNNQLSSHGIGRVLKLDNIEQHLERLRGERSEYALSHPEDIAEIAKQVSETEAYRAQVHCRL